MDMKIDTKINFVVAAAVVITLLYNVLQDDKLDSEKILEEITEINVCMKHMKSDVISVKQDVKQLSDDVVQLKVKTAGLKN